MSRREKRSLPYIVTAVGAFLLATTPCFSVEKFAVVQSDEARREAHVVNKGITWHNSLEQAQAIAKKEGKLVFWMHMLGTIDGAT